MNKNRYGCRWPDGSETGRISDSYRLAAAYAKQHDGRVWDYDNQGEAAQQHGDETPAEAATTEVR